MRRPKLIRITTVPLSLEKLLEGQLAYMKRYFEVIAISSEKIYLEKYGKQEGVSTYCLSLTRKITLIKDLVAVIKLYRFLKKEKPLIVHTHTPKAGIVGMAAAYFARIPNRLHTVAGLPLMEATGLKRKLLNLVEKFTYRFASKVYPNSKGLYDFILAKNFTKQNKLKVIGNGSSNGIDTSYFSKEHFFEEQIIEKRNELHIPVDDFVFVFVGRIVTDKGINELVEAFTKLQITHKSCSLLLVGPFEDDLDPVSEKTKKCISENSKIITTGYQDNVRIFYAVSNALVFPSYREGFPNVVMQAGAMGLPSIVCNINGCNEIIIDNKNGFVIPSKNGEKLKESMLRLITEADIYSFMRDNAREMIQSRYERTYMWEEILNEYKRL